PGSRAYGLPVTCHDDQQLGVSVDITAIDITQRVSTGSLPGWERVESLVHEAHERYRGQGRGKVADYIPALASADPDLFGLCVTEVGGDVHAAGDSEVAFSIQSISTAFVSALVCQSGGHEAIRDRVGVNNTGLPFNSVMA